MDFKSKICSVISCFSETTGEKSTIKKQRALGCIKSPLPLCRLSAVLKEELPSSTLVPRRWEILFQRRLR